MDWGLIFQVTLAVLGVALMVGGIVAYRGSARTGVRSFAAAGIASGVVMLAIVVMAVPAYSTSDGPPGPVIDLTHGSPPPSSISSAGPGISIGEAFTSNLTGPLLVNGHLLAQDAQVRLCEWLGESFPPHCGGRSLVVQGLDLTTMNGLTSQRSVTWSDHLVQILGTVEGEVLTVAATVR